MKTRALLVLSSLAATIVLIWASTASTQNYFPQQAPDGAILITQDAVLGFALADDAPGFPITISRRGSYRLAGNIVVPNADTTAIEITSNDVTLDLNGFAIVGPTVCPGTLSVPVTSCSPTGLGVGIRAGSGNTLLSNITVRNGTVTGMGFNGLFLAVLGGLVERIHASSNGGSGIFLGGGGIALNNTANLNGGHGINLIGVGMVIGNTAQSNKAFGIAANSSVGLGQNAMANNGTSSVGLATPTDGNVCNTAPCP